jgi:hypothetical protein
MFEPVEPCIRGQCDDAAAQHEYRERRVREGFVLQERKKLLREQIDKCYETSGVNHKVKCADLVKAYTALLKPVTADASE